MTNLNWVDEPNQLQPYIVPTFPEYFNFTYFLKFHVTQFCYTLLPLEDIRYLILDQLFLKQAELHTKVYSMLPFDCDVLLQANKVKISQVSNYTDLDSKTLLYLLHFSPNQ